MASIQNMKDVVPLQIVDEHQHPAKHEQRMMDIEHMVTDSMLWCSNGAESCSRAPSPPSTGANTPTLRIAPCPDRLLPIYPPFNYGTVEHKTIYRSSYPLERNIDFIMRLHIKTVLCLVETEPSQQYSNWVTARGVKRLRVDIAANKDGIVKTTTESLYEAVLYVMTKANHPIYVHCNQGKHRTGCVMACVRKVQDTMTMDEIIEEYGVYAGKKARTGDVDLIRAFDTKAFADFVSACNHILEPYSGYYVRRRVDSGTFIHELEDLAEANLDVKELLGVTSKLTKFESEDELSQRGCRKISNLPPIISQEAVSRVRLIMGVDPSP